MNTNAKKILLTGTAFLAVSLAGVGAAQAQQLIGAGTTPVTVLDGAGLGVTFTADGIGTVADGVNIGGPVTNNTATHGTLQFAGDSAVTGPVGAVAGPAGAINTIAINGANNTTVSFTGAVNAGSLTFGGAGGATFNGATTITGAIGLGSGSLTIGNGNTVTAGSVTNVGGTIIFTNDGALNSSGTIAASTLINTAGSSTVGGTGAATLGTVTVSGGTLNITNDGSKVTGTTTLNASTLNFGGSELGAVGGTNGTLNLNGALAQTVSGNLANSTVRLMDLNFEGAGTKTLNGEAYAFSLNTSGSTVDGTGAIRTTNLTNTAGASSISNEVKVDGTVTVDGGSLAISNEASTIGGTSAIGANTLSFGGSSIGALAGAGGTLNLTSNTTAAIGAVGASGAALSKVSIDGTGVNTFTGDFFANTLAFTKAGTANLAAATGTGVPAQTITFGGVDGKVIYGAGATYSGSATTTAPGTGHLVFGNDATIGATAVLGGSPNTLNTLSFAGGANTITAGSIIRVATVHTGAGTLAANETINGAVKFAAADGTTAANGVVNLADGKSITGAITTASNGTGTLNLLGAAHTVAGAIGTDAARLATVSTANATDTTTFTGGVNANTLTIQNGGSVTMNGNSAVTNALAIGDGTLTIGTGATLTADAGVTTSVTSAGVTLSGANSNLTANAASSLNGVTKTGAGTSTLGGTGATTIASVTTSGSAGAVLDITNENSSVTGNSFVGVDNTLRFAGSSLGSASGQGTLHLISGTTTVGSVGSSGNNLAAVNIGTDVKTFGANLYANNLTFSGAGTANLTATTTANAQVINFNNNAGTVQYDTGVTYTGTASSTGGAAGTLLFGDNAVVNGAVGSVGNKIGGLTLSGGANTISQSVYANTINIGSGTTAVGTGLTLDGNVVGSGAGLGVLNPAGALTITGNLSRLNALSLTNNMSVGGTAIAADTTNIGIHKLTVSGATFDTAGAATQLNFSVFNNVGGSGQIVATGATTLNIVAGTKVNVSVDTADVIVQGQEYVLIDGNEASASTIGTTLLTTTNTALLHFKQKLVADGTSDGTKNLIVYADRTQMSSVTVDPNNGAVGKMLDALGADGDADVDALQVRLANFGVGQAAAVEQMLSTLVPNVSGATVATTANLGSTTSTIVNNRVGSVRNGGTYGSGTSSGNELDGKNFWGQVFGASADQSRRGNVAGYDAESFGAVFGVDADVMDNLRAGIAFAYADTDVSGEDSNRTSTNIDSYQVSLYADWNLPNQYFVSGQLAYMYNDIETARHGVGGLAGNTARADFHSDQYTVRAEAGRSFAVERGISLTPSALVNYNYIDVEDFSETGVGGLGLRNVQTDEMQILEFGVNLMAEMNLDDGHGGIVTPNLHGGYRYDVIGDDVATSARLAGGGTAFKTQGADAAQGTANIGTGVKWSTSSNLDLSVNYDFEGKSDYKAHSGYVRAGYKF